MKLASRKTIVLFMLSILIFIYILIGLFKIGAFDPDEFTFDNNITIVRPKFYKILFDNDDPSFITMKNPLNSDVMQVHTEYIIGGLRMLKTITKHFYKTNYIDNECLIIKNKPAILTNNITMVSRDIYIRPHYHISVSSGREKMLEEYVRDLCWRTDRHMKINIFDSNRK